MGKGFRAGDESRTDRYGVGTEHERRRELASGGDAAGCQHGRGSDGLENRRDQNEGGQRAVVVTACLGALGDDQVNGRINGLLGGGDRADLLPDLDARLVQCDDELSWRMTPVEGDDGHVLVDARLDLSAIGKKSNEVDVEWSVGGGFDSLDEATDDLGRKRADRERPESSRIAHGNRQARSGADGSHGRQHDRMPNTVVASEPRLDPVVHETLLGALTASLEPAAMKPGPGSPGH